MKKQEGMPLFTDDSPDSFAMLEAMISKTGNIEQVGPVRTVSVRMPLVDYSTIEAMCQYSGQSKNKIIVQMIAACLQRLDEELSETDLKAIRGLRSKILGSMVDEETKAQIFKGSR